MPGLDLCAGGICRQRRALLPEKGHQAAAAQARVYLGRGAVVMSSPPSRGTTIERDVPTRLLARSSQAALPFDRDGALGLSADFFLVLAFAAPAGSETATEVVNNSRWASSQ